jgi:hypothetical protein
MASGGPGDHPLSDVIHYKIGVYGATADAAIRELAKLMSPRELDEWWVREIGWSCDHCTAEMRSSSKLAWARQRALDSGWDLPRAAHDFDSGPPAGA